MTNTKRILLIGVLDRTVGAIAGGLLQDMLVRKRPGQAYVVETAGLNDGETGFAPVQPACAFMAKFDIDITARRSRGLRYITNLCEYSLIICLDHQSKSELMATGVAGSVPVTMVRELSSIERPMNDMASYLRYKDELEPEFRRIIRDLPVA